MDASTSHAFTCEPVTCLKVEECRWPVEDHPYRFCNNQRRPGTKEVYCEYHAKLAYQPRAERVTSKGKIGRSW